MPIQLNIFLLLFGGLQGLLLTLFLIRRKLHRHGYTFLLLYFGVMLLQIVLKVMSKGWLMQNWGVVYSISYQLPLLYGPLAFLFVRQVTTRQKFAPADLLHFIPFVIPSTLLLFREQSQSANDVLYTFFGREKRLVMQLISLGVYHFLAYKAWQRHEQFIKKVFSSIGKLQLNWLRKFIVASFVICTIITITIFLMHVFYPVLHWLRMGFVALTIFIYWVSYAALTQPDIFSVIHGKAKDDQTPEREPAIVTDIKSKLQVHRPAKKYSNSSLPDEEAARIASCLEELMSSERPYLDPEFTIDKLAKMVSSNRHHLSQVLNQKLGLSFYDYVNTYRVNEARVLLADAARADHKIAAIAYDAGFNSLSAFNDVFKKMTGQTPSQYRKQPADNIRLQRI
jgi:AraC-like DNA-binding protein